MAAFNTRYIVRLDDYVLRNRASMLIRVLISLSDFLL